MDPEANLKPAVDLSSCEREPIHIPGAIQPHGILFVLDPDTLEVQQVSRNLSEGTGRPAEEALGQSLADLLRPADRKWLRENLRQIDGQTSWPHALRFRAGQSDLLPIAHRAGRHLILELEPLERSVQLPMTETLLDLQRTIGRLHENRSLGELFEAVTQEVRRLTGFDRVKLYRFDEDWHGEVVAEDRTPDMASYLGLHFPASDIPPQARRLYEVNPLRLVADVSSRPAPLLPELNPASGKPIDLSQAVLRAVSPIHIEYLANMGVGASMSISVLEGGRLWGLIACHHRTPRRVPFDLRNACLVLARVLSMLLLNRRDEEDRERIVKRARLQSELLEMMYRADAVVSGLSRASRALLELVEADAAAIVEAGRATRIGPAPPEEDVLRLASYAREKRQSKDVFHTASLREEGFPEAERLRGQASGVLALSLSELEQHMLLWFRAETLQQVHWGGDPGRAALGGPGEVRLHPRKSFEKWEQIQHGRSRPWGAADQGAARELRRNLVDVVFVKNQKLRRLYEALEQTNRALEQRTRELQDFSHLASHDLQEPLRKISSFLNLLERSLGDRLEPREMDYVSRVQRAAERMSRLLEDLLEYSRVETRGGEFQEADLTLVVAEVLEGLQPELEEVGGSVSVGPLPVVSADPAQMRQLLRHLLENSIKFRAEGRPLRVRISEEAGDANDRRHLCRLRLEDNGIGFDSKYADRIFSPFERLHGRHEYGGTGMGLAVCRRILERHGGGIEADGRPGEGCRFIMILPLSPANSAAGVETGANGTVRGNRPL